MIRQACTRTPDGEPVMILTATGRRDIARLARAIRARPRTRLARIVRRPRRGDR